jgi:2-phospho-L-lactate guanylyltransferase
VLAALAEMDVAPTMPVDCDVPGVTDRRDLDTSIHDQLAEREHPLAVVIADLALATPTALERLLEPNADFVLASGRTGGINAVVVCHPDFRVDDHGASI